MNMKSCGFVLLAAALALAAAPSADAQVGEEPNSETVGAFAPMRANLDDMRKRGLVETGLEAVYPAEAECLPIRSPFGSRTRHDGSQRNTRFFQGYHGGADISAAEGTPLLAVADGIVVHKYEGANIGGTSLFLQHAPQDTGLPAWVYSEYKHLMEMPDLKIGQRVRMGEPIARAGKTGTQGGRAYGAAGYSHLHWTAFYSRQPEYKAGLMFVPAGGQWLDPLALFKGPPLDSRTLHDLPASQKKIRIAYKTTDGRVVPEGAKVIWPFACTPR